MLDFFNHTIFLNKVEGHWELYYSSCNHRS